MEGFEKFDLNKSEVLEASTPVETKQPDMKKNRKKKKLSLGIGILIAVIAFIVLGVILPAIPLIADAKATYAQVKVMSAAAKTQNVTAASDELNKTKEKLLKVQKDLHFMGYLGFIPLVNWYYNDADHLVKAALYGMDGGRVLVDSVTPYADVLGLKGQGSFVGGSAQQRIQTAVTTLSKITPNIDKIGGSLALVKQELDQVDENHYPAIFGGKKIRTSIAQAKTIADDADTFVREAAPLIKVLPAQLGEPTSKRYLVLFQNDKEQRPTGGFITAYAILRLEHGVIHTDTSADIYSLDATIANKPSAPAPLKKYLPKVPEFNLRDTNLSPDFVESMKTFNTLYQKAGGYSKVDGVFAIDTYPLVDAMNILGGEMEVDGMKLNTKTDPRCDCPQVIYQLESYADQPVGYIKDNRKGLIGDLMLTIMNKAFSSSPKLYWGPLFQAMITNVAQKHIMFDVYNQDAQQGVEALNAAGKIVPFDGDYFHLNEANFGGAKSNMYVKQEVTQDYQIAADGTIQKTVTVVYKNPYKPSDCNLEHGQLCLNAVLRDWVRVYVPKGSKLVSFDGSEVKVSTYDDLDKTVFDGFITVRPLGTATVTVKYTLPFKLAKGSTLPVIYQKQPGTFGPMYTVSVNGRQKNQFQLLTDQTFKLNP